MDKLTIQQKLALLSTSPCLKHLPEQQLISIANDVMVKHYDKGEYIHRRGDEAKGYYGLISGRVRVSATTLDGKASTVHFFNSGDWFGEISLIDGIARTHDADTTEDTHLLILPKSTFEQHLMSDAESLKQLAIGLCQRLRMSFQFIEESTTQTLAARLANRLLTLHPNTQQVSQQELAQMLGVSRQSVSKQLQQWEENHWIKIQYNGLSILDPDALLELAGQPSVPMA